MAASEGRDPLTDYETINKELGEYSEGLFTKHKIVVANKMDLPQAAKNLKRFKQTYKEKIFLVSAQEKKGLEKLVQSIREILCQENFLAPSSVSSSK